MRSERERRNELKWNFFDYFLLQEELAFAYEMLGVFDEALVQYDELDALFTQFVLNSNVTSKISFIDNQYLHICISIFELVLNIFMIFETIITFNASFFSKMSDNFI